MAWPPRRIQCDLSFFPASEHCSGLCAPDSGDPQAHWVKQLCTLPGRGNRSHTLCISSPFHSYICKSPSSCFPNSLTWKQRWPELDVWYESMSGQISASQPSSQPSSNLLPRSSSWCQVHTLRIPTMSLCGDFHQCVLWEAWSTTPVCLVMRDWLLVANLNGWSC